MSLLKKASIITTPTAYAEDYLYSIKPAYALGSELVTQFDGVADGTDVATLAGWGAYNTATSRNVVDEKLVIVTSGGNQGAKFTTTTTVGNKYLFKATATGDLGAGGIYINSGSFNINLNTSNNLELRFTAESATTTLFFRASSNAAGTTTYSDISLKQVTDADFDFDRNSTGTRVNEDYLIEDVPYNLVPYSEDFTQSNYSKTRCTVTANQAIAPDGTLTADLMTATGDDARLEDQIGFSGERYTQSIFVKSAQATNVAGQIDFAGANIVTFTATDRWQRITTTLTDTAINPRVRVRITNNGDALHIWGAQVVKGDQPKDYLKTTDRLDIPRIDYTNGEGSILLEPSRTNLITYSNDFKNRWTLGSNTTVTENYAISPEGIQNASRIQTPSGAGSFASLAVPMSSGTAYAFSIYIKNNGGESLNIGIGSAEASGVDGAETIVTPTNEWVRYEVLFTADANSNFVAIDNRSNTTALDCLIYGAQLEAGSYSTSLIHTSGSAVTRSADAANNAGNSDLFNDSEGVLYVEMKALANDSTFRMLSISDGSINNRVNLLFSNTSNTIRAVVNVSLANQADLNSTNYDITEFHKVAFKYKANDFSLYIDGKEVATDTSGNVFSANTLSKLSFVRGDNNNNFYGNCKMVAVFKEALSDTELACLTGYNNHELYMNYYNRLSYLGLAEEYNVESDINNYIL